ncbi:MAG: type II secretion system F family protein [Planctomycetales bacterium]|nr:type II secretion system F family protein [Planctomycetales bacterium]
MGQRTVARQRLSLEALIAICDQIKSVADSGVPLPNSLVASSSDLNKRLLPQVRTQPPDGTDFVSAITNDSSLPPLLKTVVEAGTKSGRLSAAIESLSDSAKRSLFIHRKITQAFIYPAIILLLVAGLTFFIIRFFPERVQQFTVAQKIEFASWIQAMLPAIQWITNWIWLPCIALVVVMIGWSILSGRAIVTDSHWMQSVIRCIPWVGRLNRLGQLSTFTDLLALFVEQEIPLHEGLPLAASATGDRKMVAECNQLAIAVQQGQTAMHDVAQVVAVPNLLRWQLSAGMTQEELVRSLRSAARNYRYQAEQLADRCSIRLPVYFTILIGGSVTLLYAVIVLAPWYSLLENLAF